VVRPVFVFVQGHCANELKRGVFMDYSRRCFALHVKLRGMLYALLLLIVASAIQRTCPAEASGMQSTQTKPCYSG